MTSWANFSRKHLFAPNGLSVLRGIFGLCLPALILQSNQSYHLVAAGLFIVAAWLDYFDGLIARKFSLESSIGKLIDPLADKVLILAPLTAFSILGFFSPWWLVPLYAREIIVTFCRIGWMREGSSIGAEKLGKVKLGFQIACVGAVFLWFLCQNFGLPGFLVTVFALLTKFLLPVAVGVTLISGVSFLSHHRQLFRSIEFAKYTSACGVGLIPIVPGTWGSALATLLVLLIYWNGWLYLGTFIFVIWVGYWAVSRIDLSVRKDPNFVVIDEVGGILVTFMGIPLTFTSLMTGFILFRLFDIIKPFPLRRLEKIPGYWGILLDDLGAGLYVWFILRIFFHNA